MQRIRLRVSGESQRCGAPDNLRSAAV